MEKDEIEDSFEAEAEVGPVQTTDIQVTIPLRDSIDTSAYASAVAESTQQSLSVNSQEVQTSQDIREIHDSTEAVIPDSQDIQISSQNLLDSQSNTANTQTTSSHKESNCKPSGSEGQDRSVVIELHSQTRNGQPQNSGENSTLSHTHPERTTGSEGVNTGAQSCISWLTVKPFSSHNSSIVNEHSQATSRASGDSQKSDSQSFKVESQHSVSAQQPQSQERESIATSSSNTRAKQTLPTGDFEIAETDEETALQTQRLNSTR